MIDIDELEMLLKAATLGQDGGVPIQIRSDTYKHNAAFAYAILKVAPELLADRKRVKELEAAIQTYIDGGIPRKVGATYREDKKPSKNDTCVHNHWMYQDCECCSADWFTAALKGPPT